MGRQFHARIVRRSVWRKSVYLVLSVFVIAGCSLPYYGVVLWADRDSVLQNGSLVRVSRSVGSDGMVEVVGDDGERYHLRDWQVERFRLADELTQFLEAYSLYQQIFAQCEKKALPIREKADRFSDTLYRLDHGEVIKILDRGEEMTNEAGLEDYWYYVLTSSGTRGWVFGYHLSIIDVQQNAVVAKKEARDNIASFLNTIWRPAYFTEMKSANSFDLERFGRRFGLFPFPLESTIQLSLPDYYFEVVYTAPFIESTNSFYFGDNNQLKVTLSDSQTVIAEVNDGVDVQQFIFHLFLDDVQQIVNTLRAEQRASASGR